MHNSQARQYEYRTTHKHSQAQAPRTTTRNESCWSAGCYGSACCWSAGCCSAGCCCRAAARRAGTGRGGLLVSGLLVSGLLVSGLLSVSGLLASGLIGELVGGLCGRQAASRWAAGPRATGLAWRASVVGCSAGCLVAGCRWSAGGQSAGCRWLAGGCQSAGCWSRVATWHMRPTAAPKPQFFSKAQTRSAL